jgi:hypothetical protein
MDEVCFFLFFFVVFLFVGLSFSSLPLLLPLGRSSAKDTGVGRRPPGKQKCRRSNVKKEKIKKKEKKTKDKRQKTFS